MEEEWLAWCYFHLGEYSKALNIYDTLYETETDPTIHLYKACCYLYLENYEKAKQEACAGPNTRLQNRILLHISHREKNDTEMMKYYHKITDTAEDQLSLAAVHFLRSQFQDGTDIYKKAWLTHREQLAVQVYVAFGFYQLDRHDTSNEILQP